MFYNTKKLVYVTISTVLFITVGLVYAQQLGSNSSTMKPYIPPELNYLNDKRVKLKKLDLNTASLQQLMNLPQINEDIALKIMRKRPIKSLEDIYYLPFLDVDRVKIIIDGLNNLVTQPIKSDKYDYLRK